MGHTNVSCGVPNVPIREPMRRFVDKYRSGPLPDGDECPDPFTLCSD